jgi:Crinkler effector protein N-terminal domain
MSDPLEFFCWILRDDPHHVFLVKITSSEMVGHLQKAIKKKKKNVFGEVDANLLGLWKVSNCGLHI